MRRRRSKPRVVWLPPDPTNRVTFDGTLSNVDQAAQGGLSLQFAGAYNSGEFVGAAIPLVGDFGNAEDSIIGQAGSSTSLSDMFNSGYRLRRIVGSIFCCLQQQGADVGGSQGNVMVTAGIQVMRVDPTGIPTGASKAPPDTYENATNPWIWRRSWALNNGLGPGYQFPLGPGNNAGYGSVREGTFVDQKTVRIIGPDERLFMCLQGTVLQSEIAANFYVPVFWNLRVLASLRNNLGNRNNSSR